MQENAGQIQDVFIEDELKDSYLIYSMSVIVSRALPDVRDGLKPSQRRILVAMNDLHLSPRGKYRKCAKIAGDTSGNYHPHGEQVIYPTLVRMAQPFSTRYLLVDGQGNFGSVDGDTPAAMRYTEARMTNITTDMMEDIDKETVDFKQNYDESMTEPTVLPAKFPNLLCNGATGIAVGMTTNIPPHNFTEVANGVVHLIDNPDCSIDDLMHYIQGPDFPTAGLICGTQGIKDAYHTGRGRVIVRGKAHFEESKNDKTKIVFTSIPYYANKVTIIEKIVEAVKTDRISGIADVNDESDKEGMRLVIETKRGEDPDIILNKLYKVTPLQSTFGCILLALVNDRPRVLNLKEMLSEFLKHRVEVIRRRTRFLLDKAEARAHILEGLRIALDNIDEVIETIRSSQDKAEAIANLMAKFQLSELQADAIVQMRLLRLVGLEREKIEKEYQDLLEEIKGYQAILADINLVYDIIKEDMLEMKEKHKDARRSEIVAPVEGFSMEDLIADEDVCVTISHNSFIKRMDLDTYRSQHRGGKGVRGMSMRDGDFIENLFVASNHNYILFFTNMGQVYWLRVFDIPEMSRTSKGRALVNLLQMRDGEKIEAMIPVKEFDSRGLILATKKGIIKKTALNAFSRPKKNGIIAIRLDEGDEVVSALLADESQEIIIATQNGKAIRFPSSDIRELGRATRGVGGIKLKGDDEVVSLVATSENHSLLTLTESGMGKRSAFDSYRLQSRNGSGVINMKLSEKTGKVVKVLTVTDQHDIMMITKAGMVVRTSLKDVRIIGRATSGVKILSLTKDSDCLVSVAKIENEEPIIDEVSSEDAQAIQNQTDIDSNDK